MIRTIIFVLGTGGLITLWAVAEVRAGATSPRQLAAAPARAARWLWWGMRWPARRRAALDQRLYEWPAILRSAMSDRGHCAVCGEDRQLKRDGRVVRHHDCPGGDELPGPSLIGVES